MWLESSTPEWVVITTDNVVHRAGCSSGTSQALTLAGWKRVIFNPADARQLTPAVQPGTTVKTIALVMDQVGGRGIAVLDNININGKFLGKQ